MSAQPSFCFMHVADLHLDTPFKGLGVVAPGVAEALREASLEALDSVVDLALDHDAAFLLVAGDVYDGPARGLRAQRRFLAALERLSDAGVETFVVHGNHDPEGGWSAIRRWPDRVTVFPSGAPQCRTVERDGAVLATVQGISYGRAAETENLARYFRRPAGPGVHVGLLHCAVAGASEGHAPYSPCTIADLRATGLDYLALGHVHRRRVLAEGPGQPWIVYPGSLQARSLRPGETGAKGATIVEVCDGTVSAARFEACDAVRLATVEVPIDSLGGLVELAARLEQVALDERDRARRPVVVRARLSGSGPLHAELARPGALDELLASVRAELPAEGWFCWLAAVTDDSRAPVRLDDLRARDDFAGDLVRLSDELGDDPEAMRALLEEAGTLPRVLAGRPAAAVPASDVLASLVERARALALSALEVEGPSLPGRRSPT